MAKEKIDKRSIARTLYIEGSFTFEEIAAKVQATRQTVSRWAKEGAWAETKASLSITPAQLISQWQQQILEINRAIAAREEGKRYATPAEADAMHKLASSIDKIQDDLGIKETVGVCVDFLSWLRKSDKEQALIFNNLIDVYIKDKANR